MLIQSLVSTVPFSQTSPAARVTGTRNTGPVDKSTGATSRPHEEQDTVEISPEAQAIVESQPDAHEHQQVAELKRRDHEVRSHELAHAAAAGPYAMGGPTYEYRSGPNGQRYVVGGEVQIDTAPVEGNPEATIEKARAVRAAALAPALPSAQDRAVAAAASQMEADARAKLAQDQAQTSEESEAAASNTDSASYSETDETWLIFDTIA